MVYFIGIALSYFIKANCCILQGLRGRPGPNGQKGERGEPGAPVNN